MATDTKIILKRSDIATAAPNLNYLEFGELAFNYKDEKLYYRTYQGATEVISHYDFQRIIPVAKGGTGASTAAGARLGIGAAPLHDPSFTGIASLAAVATQPAITLDTSDASSRRLATVGYVRAEIADDAPTKTGGGASGDNWNIGIQRNAATASKWKDPRSIVSNNTAAGSDITFSVTLDGSANVTPTLSINENRRSAIQSALSLVPGTHIQAYDADLRAIAELPGTSGLLRKTAADTWSLDTTTYTPTARTLTITTNNGIEGGLSAQSLADNRAWTLGLTTTGVVAGTYNNNSTTTNSFTVDDRGRITSVGNALTITPHFDSITNKPTTLSGYGITDALDISSTPQTKTGSLTASSFIKSGGTSSQFLKADGSSDSTPYTPQARTLTIANGTGITGGASAADLSANRSWTLGLTGQALRVHNLTSNGFFVRASDASVVARSIVPADQTEITIMNGDGVSGDPTISLTTSNLTSLRGITTAGFLTRTGANTLTPRSIAVSGIGLSINNADGALGNPTIVSNATSANDVSTLVARDAFGAFSAGTITGSSFVISGTTFNTTLAGSAAGTSKTLILPNKSDTIATLTDIPSHTGGANTTIPTGNGVVLSAITVNALGHTTSVSSKTLAAVDIPDLPASKITSGTFDTSRITDASVTGKVLTGFVAGTSVSFILATDTILQAFQKIVPNIAAKANSASPVFTGTVTLSAGTASGAPLRITPGVNATASQAGDLEFNGTALTIVNNSLERKTLAYIDSNVTSATTATSAGKWTTAKSISNSVSPGNNDVIFSVSLDGSADVIPTLTLNSARASAMRTTLGLEKGVDGGVQEYDADLAAIAALADGPDGGTEIDTGYLRKTGVNTWIIDQETVPPGIDELYTISGDVIGSSPPASRNIVAELAPISGLTAGTYNGGSGTPATISSITPFQIDAKGRVTAAGTAVPISLTWGSITNTPTTLANYGITDGQVSNSNLTAISAIGTTGSNGLLRRNADNSWSFDTTAYTPQSRTLTIAGATNSGITVTPSTATNLSADRSWSISLTSGNLTQLRDLGANTGIIAHNGAVNGGMVTRSIVSADNADITITNGNGVLDNPTIALTTSNLTSLRALSTTGLVARTAANTVTSRSIAVASGSTGLSITNGDGVSGNPTLTLSSTSLNTNNSLVARDATGGFAAGTITATNFRASQGVPNSIDASTVGYAFGADGDTGLFSPIVGSGGNANGVVSLYSNNTETLRSVSTGVTLYGTPTAPTPLQSDNSTTIATTSYVRTAISSLVNSAPATLDTLKEISDYISTDNATGAIATALAAKAPLASPTFTGTVKTANLIEVGDATGDARIEIGTGATGNRWAYTDYIGDAVYTDYGLRVARGNAGANTDSFITHRGTGSLTLSAEHAGSVRILTTNTERLRVTSTGNILVGTTTETTGHRIQVGGSTTTDSATAISVSPTIANSTTNIFKSYLSSPVTAASAFTLGGLYHYTAEQPTLGANSKISSQIGFFVGSDLIGAETNVGFYSYINDSSATLSNLARVGGIVTLTTTGAHSFKANQQIVVTAANSAVNGTFTIISVPSSNTLTYAQSGSDISSTTTTGNINSFGRSNIMADGTAPNFFEGNVGIGIRNSPIKLDVADKGTIARFSGSGSEWQGIVIRPTDSNAATGRGAYVDFHNENNICLTSLLSYHTIDGGSDVILHNTPTGVRNTDRRAERIRVTREGKTLIGSANAFGTRFGNNNITPNTQIHSYNTGGTNLNDSSSTLLGRFSNDADSSKLFFAKTRGASSSAPVVVNSGDNLGWLSFGGYDGVNMRESARIAVIADNSWNEQTAAQTSTGFRYKISFVGTTDFTALGASANTVGTIFTRNSFVPTTIGTGKVTTEPGSEFVPGSIIMSTGTAGTMTERMRISPTGNVGIGKNNPTTELDVNGTISAAYINDIAISRGVNGFSNYNLAIGGASNQLNFPLGLNESGTTNVVVGDRSLTSNTTGGANVVVGWRSMANNTAGSNNTAIGKDTLSSNTTGTFNTAVGGSSLSYSTIGWYNTAIGQSVSAFNVNGQYNVGLGYAAMNQNTSGSNNIGIGYAALYHANSGANTISVTSGNSGLTAGNYSNVPTTYVSGGQLGVWNTPPTLNVVVSAGGTATATVASPGRGIIATGAIYSAVIGTKTIQVTVGSLRKSDNNTAIGNEAGCSLNIGSDNIFIGPVCNTGGAGNSPTYFNSGCVVIGPSSINRINPSSTTVVDEVSIGNGAGRIARFQGAAANGWTFVSDARDKRNVTDIDLGLDFVNQLQPRKFEWNHRTGESGNGEYSVGFIAQELLEVVENNNAPHTQLVNTSNPDQYTVAQTNLIPILVNAIKELSAELQSVKAELAALSK